MTEEKPLVSVILLNYNSADLIESCMASVLAQVDVALELIVVDNASDDDSMTLAEEAAAGDKRVRFLFNKENLGFAGGMNAGATVAQGRYLMFLNSDVTLAEDHLSKIVAAFRGSTRRLGAVGGRIYRLVGGEKTEYLDTGPVFLGRGFRHKIGRHLNSPHLVFGPTGCCPTVSAKMLADVALANGDYFDSDYFMYSEDTDLWFRAQLRGWQCLYEPQALAWHVRSASVGGGVRNYQRAFQPQRWAYRNRWITMVKVLPFSLFLRLLPYLFLMELLTSGFLLLKSFRGFFARLVAAADFLLVLPATMRKRRYIQSRRKVMVRDLTQLLQGF